MGRTLMLIGGLLLVAGLLFHYTNLGRLPGDVVIRKKNFTLYFPLATCIVLSIVFTLLMWLLGKRSR